ncbi:MAG TPA: RNA-binding transcriptional accessory protein [Firmicutes bacterium]|nr:MAG: hypothetical protein AA931_06935 [Peptococcaceae bacterium 1109]HHT72388.1 RNA-binding transcriptional accessory protein [Bacillota bacterium]
MIKKLAQELSLREHQVQQTVTLLDQGNTIPFIARYRKEATGELDEVQIRALSERLAYLRGLESRKAEVLRLIGEQGKLTAEIEQAVRGASSLQEVEDLYQPFRPKRKTRASAAKEKGLEPLAEQILKQEKGDPASWAGAFLSEEVPSPEEALSGAQDIIAEYLTDLPEIRQLVRKYTYETGIISASLAVSPEEANAKEFQMYWDYAEEVRKIPPHRILALNRGERLGVLQVKIAVDEQKALAKLSQKAITNPHSPSAPIIEAALADGYKRLLAPSIERDIRRGLTETAEAQAIEIFATNLRSLLMQPPVRCQNVLGIDPAFRTGCKVVAVDQYGVLLDYTTIYPHEPHKRRAEALNALSRMVEQYKISLIVIGNGTASRETEQLVAELIKSQGKSLRYLVINEAGASVYSASEVAREEFPQLDVAMRGAVSIARRVQDPLAELVKIDPKSIGVGQYQHDVNQKELSRTLDAVVESCVNYVGVELNSASQALLGYVAGLSKSVANQIVEHRVANGPFRRRSELKKVKGLGPKTFEQAAGFLRIAGGEEPLDNTAVHPESYDTAREILVQIGFQPQDMAIPDRLKEIRSGLKALDPAQTARALGAGEPTVRDIIAALGQPGRDPRDELPPPHFRADVLKIEDLQPGMILTGTVQNVVDFGAFVDIGVGKSGLVHISELSTEYVRHPTDVVQVGDVVSVQVLKADPELGRISLTMKIS